MVPACQTLDCVSIFARTAAQADRVLTLADRRNPADPWQEDQQPPRRLMGQSFRFGVPAADQLGLVEYPEAQALFDAAVAHLEALGGTAVDIDLTPFSEAAALLYDGPWVSERQLAVNDLVITPDQVHPVVRDVLSAGDRFTAGDAFSARYRLAALKRRTDAVLATLDTILTPTCPAPYTIADMMADPVALNARLGAFTNFMNLLDYSAVSVPAGFLDNGMPGGSPCSGRPGATARSMAWLAACTTGLPIRWEPPATRYPMNSHRNRCTRCRSPSAAPTSPDTR